nr:hypothetical protein [Methylobacterium sp. L1A1]
MADVVPFLKRDRAFDAQRARAKTPGVRVALDFGYWCVERLAGYVITGRTRMPTRAAANTEAVRIAREESVDLLATRMPPRERDFPNNDGSGGAAGRPGAGISRATI